MPTTDWYQDVDYQSPVNGDTFVPVDVTGGLLDAGSFADPGLPYSSAWVVQEFEALKTAALYINGGRIAAGLSYTLSNGDSFYRASKNLTVFGYDASRVRVWSPSQAQVPPPSPESTIEVEGLSRSAVIGAHTSGWLIRQSNRDSAAGAPLPDGEWETLIQAQTTGPFTVTDGVMTYSHSAEASTPKTTVMTIPRWAGLAGGARSVAAPIPDIDVSAHLIGVDGLVVLTTRTNISVSPVPSFMANGNFVQMGADVSNSAPERTVVYTLRPPRYRYVTQDANPLLYQGWGVGAASIPPVPKTTFGGGWIAGVIMGTRRGSQ